MNIKIIKKNVKNMTLKIRSIEEIEIVAPKQVKDEYIKAFVFSKEKWIKKKSEELTQKKTIIKKLITGETIFYLGKEYNLIVEKNTKNYIKINNDSIYIYSENPNSYKLKLKLLTAWYKEQGKIIFFPVVEKYLKLTEKTITRVSIKTMKTKWGSCNFIKKYINLNSEMVKKDIKFIEYVILHEISHLEYPNHSKSFYNYLESFMPDYKERRKIKG